MDWNYVAETGNSPAGEQVMVETQEGSLLYATYGPWSHDQWGDYDYQDASGAKVWSPVVRWRHLVSSDETP